MSIVYTLHGIHVQSKPASHDRYVTFPLPFINSRKKHTKSNFLNMRLDNSVVLIHHLLIERFVEHVYLCFGKLSRADLLLEQDIKFGKGASAWFG